MRPERVMEDRHLLEVPISVDEVETARGGRHRGRHAPRAGGLVQRVPGPVLLPTKVRRLSGQALGATARRVDTGL